MYLEQKIAKISEEAEKDFRFLSRANIVEQPSFQEKEEVVRSDQAVRLGAGRIVYAPPLGERPRKISP